MVGHLVCDLTSKDKAYLQDSIKAGRMGRIFRPENFVFGQVKIIEFFNEFDGCGREGGMYCVFCVGGGWKQLGQGFLH